MTHAISLHGIDQAISSLRYENKKSLKYRLIQAIRSFYDSEQAVGRLSEIPAESLIPMIWGTAHDIDSVQSKRKNLSSLRSSVNTDLLKRFRSNENTEGVIIGPTHTFIMSDEAKDKLLGSFAASFALDDNFTLEKATALSGLLGEFLSKNPDAQTTELLKAFVEGLTRQPPHMLSEETTDQVLDTFGQFISRLPDAYPLDKNEKFKQLIRGLSEKTEMFDIRERTDGKISEKPIDPEPSETVEVLETVDEPDAPERSEEIPDIDSLEVVEESELDEIEESEWIDDEEISDADTAESADDPEPAEDVLGDFGPEQADADAEIEAVVEILEEPPEPGREDSDEVLGDSTILENVDEEALEDIAEMDDAEASGLEPVNPEDLCQVDELIEAEGEADSTPDNNREMGLLWDAFGGDEFDIKGMISDIEKRRLLAERFDGYLGAMERYFNQYLLVPKGIYTVGSKNPQPFDRALQTLSLSEFYIGKYPVTNALFEIFIERTGYKTVAEKKGFGIVYEGRFKRFTDEQTGRVHQILHSAHRCKEVNGAYWYQPLGPGSTLHKKRNHPVVQIGLTDAMAFAAWIGKRLPTENEWEAAATTQNGHRLPWGDEWQDEVCNMADSGVSDTVPVDAFPAAENGLGLCDLLGNTMEWTLDRCADGSPHPGRFIVKGGGWISDQTVCLSSRLQFPPDYTANILGFRCIAD